MVAIITDSSACVPAGLAGQLGITLVPIRVSVDGDETPVHEVDRHWLLERIEAGDHVTTSAPTPGAFLEAIETAAGEDGVLVVTLASSMSSTHQAASVAASQSSTDVRVLDSGTAAGGLGLVAAAAADAARAGDDLDAVEARAQMVAGRVRLIAVVGSLEHLARSGRVPQIASKAGDALGVRPMFEFRDGEPRVLRPSLSTDGATARILNQWRKSRPDRDGVLHVAALHADAEEDARRMLEVVRSACEPATAFVAQFDAAMMVHTGPDLRGLAWWWE